MNVLTFITSTPNIPLITHCTTIARLLDGHVDCLADGIAYDVFTSHPIAESLAIAHQEIQNLPIDIIGQNTGSRRKSLLISDMDSTVIEQECIDEIADYIGKKDAIAQITEQAMRGEIAFAEALTARVALLKGIPEDVLAQAFAHNITFTSGAKTLVATIRHHGAFCLLVSGGFTFFTQKVQEHLGFHANEANRLEIISGKLSGKVVAPILGKEAKVTHLNAYAKAHSIALSDTLAVGDGANDIPMLHAAGLGVSYHAKPIVKAAVSANITHTDLKSLLYIQGYKAADMVDTLS